MVSQAFYKGSCMNHHALSTTRKILDASRRGGGILDFPQRGGTKIFSLDHFFFKVTKTPFFHVFGVFGTLFIFWSMGGGEKFQMLREGGGKFF